MKIEVWDTDRVLEYKNNVKIHNKDQVEKIAKSIAEFGFDQPIVVDEKGVIIKGHGRHAAAKLLGLKQVPVLVRDDLTEEQANAARLADNRVAIGDFDTIALQKELESIDFDFHGIFDDKELDFMEADLCEIKPGGASKDLFAEIEEKTAETAEKIESLDKSDKKINEALGFNYIRGSEERIVARFMAEIEAKTNLTGGDAFVAFAKEYLDEQR